MEQHKGSKRSGKFRAIFCKKFVTHKMESVSMHPDYGNPRTGSGLLRTSWEPDRVLRSPLEGFLCSGAQTCATRRAFLCTGIAPSWVVTGKLLDSPEKGMSTKCPKNVQKLSRGPEKHNFQTFFGQFLPIWSMLLFGDTVQCSPVTSLGGMPISLRNISHDMGYCSDSIAILRDMGPLSW